MELKILFSFVAVLFLESVVCSSEIWQIKQMHELGIKRAKFEKEKWNKLLNEQPELKRYISRPSSRKLLKNHGKRVDTIYVLGIRVEFEEDTSSLYTGNGLIDIDGNPFPYDLLGERGPHDPPFDSIVGEHGYHNLYYDPPHTKRYFEHLLEFIQNYWWDVSEHQVWIEYRVVPDAESLAYKLPHKPTYYGDPDNYVRGILTLFRDAVETCDQESPEIDFSLYARNSGAVVVFHAGASWQTDYFGDSDYDIPDCFISGIDGYFGQPIWVDNGTVPIVDGVLYSETAFQDGMPGFLQGGLCHEFGHQLGLFDLYDTDGKTMGIGGWSLMGTGNWNLNGLLPPAPCAWSTAYLGFIEPVVIASDSEAIHIYHRCGKEAGRKIYKVPINTREHFLIEERFVTVSPDTTVYKFEYSSDSVWHIDSTGVRVWKDGVLTSFMGYYDWGLPPDSGMGGLAVWHIDETKIARDSSANEINAGSPKGVDMEEADGIQDFDTPWWLVSDIDAFFYGSPYDVFYNGNLDKFTPWTSPNTNDNIGSFTHISIYDISVPDTIMNYSVKFDMRYHGFPVQCGSFFDVNSPNVALVDTSYVIFTGVMDTLLGNVVCAVRADGSILWKRTIPTDEYMGFYGSVAIGDIDGNGVLDVVATPFTAKDTTWGKSERYKINPEFHEFIKFNKDKKAQESLRFAQHFKSAGKETREVKVDTFLKVWGQLFAWDVYGNKLLSLDRVTDCAIIGAPLLADINGDGKDEIMFGSDDGKLRVFNGVGDTLWTRDLYEFIWATPVWDSTSRTLYACALDGKLWALASDGSVKWTAIEPRTYLTTSSPVVGDIDRDGMAEVILPTGDGSVFCISEEGKIKWERQLDDATWYSSPALADIDKDDFLDIVIAAGSKIYVLNNNGANVPGFPVNTGAGEDIQSSPVIGDVNGDGKLEIVIGSPDGSLLAYNNKGNLVSGFPLSVGGSVYSTPQLVDLNRNGLIDIFVGCEDGKLYGWSAGSTGELPWPRLHYTMRNNGIYEKLVPIPFAPGSEFLEKDFYVYPNPVTDRGWVRYFSGDATTVDIKIINLAGDIVKEFKGKIGKNTYQDVLLPSVPSGVYLVRVEVDGRTRFKKFAVVK